MNRKQELDELVTAFGRHLHEAHANPDRVGCPDQATLLALANEPAPGEAFTSFLDHISHCAPCLEELARLRKQRRQSFPKEI